MIPSRNPSARDAESRLEAARRRIVACRRCPELRRYCADIAGRGKREFVGQSYWGKPVPSYGAASARLLLVGLAPAAHGGNRTGRMFTGDGSANWLARALYRAGFATKATSMSRADDFRLVDAFMSAALRCAPPKNKPTPRQLANCADHLRAELTLLADLRVVVGLGKIGFDTIADRLRERDYVVAGIYSGAKRPRFAHGAEYRLQNPAGREMTLLGCYHPSRQNTQTGKLTETMLDAVFAQARQILNQARE